jgi:hypothetical protein
LPLSPSLAPITVNRCGRHTINPTRRQSCTLTGRTLPFHLTIGWIEQQGRARFQHDEDLIACFLALKEEAWRRKGLPFHIWLTSPALEIIDVTFAMNLGWAKSREECARLSSTSRSATL